MNLRKALMCIVDFFLLNFAIFFTLLLKYDTIHMHEFYSSALISNIEGVIILNIVIYYFTGLYSSVWKYASIDELGRVVVAVLLGMFIFFTANKLSGEGIPYIPSSVYVIMTFVAMAFIGGVRVAYRILRRTHSTVISKINNEDKKRVLIVGAGDAASTLIKELNHVSNTKFKAVAVVDDAIYLQKTRLHGVPVVGLIDNIVKVVAKYRIDEIIVAIPSASKLEMSRILRLCKETKCKLNILPNVFSMLYSKNFLKDIREVNIEDLLGREEIKLDTTEAEKFLKDEVVLISGGGGSIGSELCRQVAKFHPKKILILDIYENGAYDLQMELLHQYGRNLDVEVLIGTVKDVTRLNNIFEEYSPGVVFHAAAHKHVPLMEKSPGEAIKNNVFGTLNIARCADKYNVKRFVHISTDKAVNPTNIMGATKRLSEMIIQSINKESNTDFVAVRFGNVLGSNGSVIPLFKRQIERGGPVTVTHKDIIRYFMTIPEAVCLVLQAASMAKGGEIFILDMGEPVKIYDLAKDLIRLSGLEPEKDIKIEFTGLRPGEKLYEELMLDEEGALETSHKRIYTAMPINLDFEQVMNKVNLLKDCNDNTQIRRTLMKIVPTFVPTVSLIKSPYSNIDLKQAEREDGDDTEADDELEQNSYKKPLSVVEFI